MNPQVGQPQNPFMQMLQKMQAQGTPQAPGQNQPGIQALLQRLQNPGGGAQQPQPGMSQPGGAPVGMPQGAGQGAGLPGVAAPQAGGADPTEDAAMPGQNPGVSKQLMGAMNQLHQAITAMTDPQEIRMIRSILVLLSNLVQRDQEVQNGRTGTTQPQQPPQPPAGGNFGLGGAMPPQGGGMSGMGGQ